MVTKQELQKQVDKDQLKKEIKEQGDKDYASKLIERIVLTACALVLTYFIYLLFSLIGWGK